MRISSSSEDSVLLQKIADRNEQFDKLMNSSDVESSTVQENSPEGNAHDDDDDDDDDVEADEEEDSDEQVPGQNEAEEEADSQITRIPIDSKVLRDCSYKSDILQYNVERSHVIGNEENNKKFYYNSLR
jgi:hypothetical protein